MSLCPAEEVASAFAILEIGENFGILDKCRGAKKRRDSLWELGICQLTDSSRYSDNQENKRFSLEDGPLLSAVFWFLAGNASASLYLIMDMGKMNCLLPCTAPPTFMGSALGISSHGNLLAFRRAQGSN